MQVLAQCIMQPDIWTLIDATLQRHILNKIVSMWAALSRDGDLAVLVPAMSQVAFIEADNGKLKRPEELCDNQHPLLLAVLPKGMPTQLSSIS